jgi:sugar (pentulose or hexulose) kinase
LVNVDAFSDPVPSSRFMGGRENQMLAEALPAADAVDVERALARRVIYLPAAQQGSGPFPTSEGRWHNAPATPGEQRAAVSFYLALMSATCLELIGARGPTVVEGPFAGNAEFAAMLGAATGREVIAAPAGSGTSIGAALLAGGHNPKPNGQTVAAGGPAWAAYAAEWRRLAGR